MKITNILLSKNEDYVILSADVVFDGSQPETMYFRTDKKNEKFIVPDASSFLAAVLLPCMKEKEDIFIEGSISKKLSENTNEIMKLVEKWNIGLDKVKISALEKKEDSTHPSSVACFFSAGVDSFYTYLKNRNDITHLLFVHGFDIPLENIALFADVREKLLEIAKIEKKELITIETNAAEILEKRLVWDFSHGGVLAAVGLLLRGGLKTVYISSAVRRDELFPYGTHPNLDKLWSSETLNFVHFGSEYNRLEKVVHSVSKSDLALSYLHVCAQNRKGKYNCSKCYKCLMTMIELICTGSFDRAKTFDHPIDLQAVRNMYYDYKLLYNLQGEANLKLLREQNREPELQRAIEESLEKSKSPSFAKKVSRLIAQFDQKYNDRRFYRFVFKINNSGDRNIFFKILSKGGFLK